MKKIIPIAILIIAIIVASTFGYVYSFGPATVKLAIIDPPPEPYDSSILHIYIIFSKVEIHVANAGNESGWHTIATNASVDLMKTLDASTVIASGQVPPGKYTEIRFFTSQAIITIGSLNITYTIPSGEQTGFKVVIQGGGFQVLGSQTATIVLDIAFRNSEIFSGHILTPVAVASVQ